MKCIRTYTTLCPESCSAVAQRTRHYNRNMGLKTWKKWTDWPLMVLSVVFLVVYSWEILSRTHIALCETVINVIWVVFVVDYVVSLWLADDRWRWSSTTCSRC